jgi:hypothetical protein
VGGTTARLLCLALAAAGLAGLPGTSLPAAAASAQRIAATEPIAIGVNSFGTSYVGFATGGALARFNADGKKLAPLGLDQQGPVTAISVAPDDRVWVYYGTSVSAFEPGGRLHRHFDVAEPGSCAGNAHDPSRYGGLVVTATTVYVASRCTNTLEAYSKFGLRQARVDLPSGGYPRGVAWMAPQGNPKLPARLFVAMPNRGELLTYNAETLRSASRPTARHQVERPDRGSKPEPSGVTADRYGIVAVTDAANHAVNIYNANSGMSRFRVLGHPPRAGEFAGALDRATAMAQHDQDGGGLSGNLFIADTGNGRAQRWDIGGGYTYWAKSVSAPRPGDPGDPGGPGDPDDPDPGDPDDPGGPGGPDDPGGPGGPDDPWIPDPGDPTDPTDPDDPIDPDDPDPGDPGDPDPGDPDEDGAPVSTVRPSVVGVATTGRTVSCSAGTWQGQPTGYGFRWLRDGALLPAATASTYVVVAGDLGTELSCRVTASNAEGSTVATSDPVFVGDPVAPVNATAPAISGVLQVGRTLTCSTGTWSGAPTYSFIWLRGGVLVGNAPTYVVASGDSGRSVTCTVIATTSAGSQFATSAPVVIS